MKEFSEEYAVFFDIDGTILGKSDETLRKNLDTIQKMRRLGHKAFINTGRSTVYIPEKLDVKRNFDGVISGAGAIARIGEKVIFKKLMPYETVKKACRLFLSLDKPTVLEGEEKLYYFLYAGDTEEKWVKLDKENISKEITEKTPIEKFTVLGTIPEEILNTFKGECFMLQHPHYGEIIRNDTNKALAMQAVMEELKIPMERCIAVGDSMNDYAMLKAAGISVAMGNSVPEIKAIADYQTLDVDDAGVAEFLKKMFNMVV